MASASRGGVVTPGIGERVAAIDWEGVGADLDAVGHARIRDLLTESECRSLAADFDDDDRFRSTIDMARHSFGEGRYRYFANPLPSIVCELREELYRPLASIANGWRELLGSDERFPATLEGFNAVCHSAGQERPTPLLLRYETGGYNCLHQDLYGDVAFPLQVAVLLSTPGEDFDGGEFLLVEQRPRRQSRGEAIALAMGEAVVFPNRERPVQGKRGFHRTQMRHGVSRVQRGTRTTLGIIFHDAT